MKLIIQRPSAGNLIGWQPPVSWLDLKDKKYRKLLVIPPLNNTYGLHTLVMFARLNGGGEQSIDPGFKVVKDLGAHDELLALAATPPIAKGAFAAAVKMYPGETIELRQGARVVERSRG